MKIHRSAMRLLTAILAALAFTPVPAAEEHHISPSADEQWTTTGYALVTDGWFSPLSPDGNTEPYEVELQMNSARNGVYRLVNPFTNTDSHTSSIPDVTADTTSDHYMVIDVSHPGCVVIPLFNTGIHIDGREVMAGNTAGFYFTTYGYDISTYERYAMSSLGAGYIDRFTDMKVTVNLSCHAFNDNPSEFTAWPGTKAATSVIDLTNAASIASVPAENDRPEYFTLQGMPVSSPVCGQIVICRTSCGSHVTFMPR